MARYGQGTDAASVDNIDVVTVAARIAAASKTSSAFMPNVYSRDGARKQIWTKDFDLAWGTHDADLLTEPDETEYVPTSVSTTNTMRYVDAVISQYALQDGETSGTPIEDQVVRAGTRKYASYFDATCAALEGTIATSSPDHTIGSTTAALTGPLIDEAVGLMAESEIPGTDRMALIIATQKVREFWQIPGMRDKDIRGRNGEGAIDGPQLQVNSKLIASGLYGGTLDVYHSPDLVDDAPGLHHMLLAVGSDPEVEAGIVNPYSRIMKGGGMRAPGKLDVEVWYNNRRRAVEIMMTTVEDFEWHDSSTASAWGVNIVTAS